MVAIPLGRLFLKQLSSIYDKIVRRAPSIAQSVKAWDMSEPLVLFDAREQ